MDSPPVPLRLVKSSRRLEVGHEFQSSRDEKRTSSLDHETLNGTMYDAVFVIQGISIC